MSRRDYIFVENNCKNLVCPVVGYPSVYDGLLLSLEGASCFRTITRLGKALLGFLKQKLPLQPLLSIKQ